MEKERFLQVINERVEEANRLHCQVLRHQNNYNEQKEKCNKVDEEFYELSGVLDELYNYTEVLRQACIGIKEAVDCGKIRDKRCAKRMIKERKKQIEDARMFYAGKMLKFDELKEIKQKEDCYLKTLEVNLECHIERLEIVLFQINSLLDSAGYPFTPLTIYDYKQDYNTFKQDRVVFPYTFTENGFIQNKPAQDENEQ